MSSEALVSFAFLLSALALLIAASANLSGAFSKRIANSSERLSLSNEALILDSASFFAGSASLGVNITGMPSQGALASRANPSIQEKLFSSPALSQDGVLHVEKSEHEPV